VSESAALRNARLMRDFAIALADDDAPLWPACAPALLALSGARGLRVESAGARQAFGDARGDGGFAVPIVAGGATLATMIFEGAGDDAEVRMLLESCALGLASRLTHEDLAFTDALTGIANRRAFDRALERERARAARENASLAILMIDLDYFKLYNDAYGHPAGDDCLRHVAAALRANVRRPGDAVARYGGEEFVALLPGADVDGGIAVAEELRAAIAASAIVHAGSTLGHISISIGVAAESAPGDAGDLLNAADEALYQAKIGGRDRVVATGYQSESDGARPARTTARNNLPLQLTRMIGRDREVRDIGAEIERFRLVSVVGVGGSGKTRVAIAAGNELLDRFEGGVWFADLTPINDPGLIVPTIAAAFGKSVTAGDVTALAHEIDDARTLLVLDNCEHLIADASSVVSRLLRACPELRVLATSREPLDVTGGGTYQLPLLETGDAVALFVERASAAARDFAVTDANVAQVVEICRRLDGIALAIELAASRVGAIGLDELARRFDGRQTTRELIDWSYYLLSGRERRVFRRLAVFSGGFSLDAVAAVCADDMDRDAALDVTTSLIRKSLISHEGTADIHRHRLLESIREYARERLSDDEVRRTARLHAEFYLEAARRAEAAFDTTPSAEWVTGLTPELDNFRAALEWALVAGNDPALGASLTAALIVFLSDVAPSECTRWMRLALDSLPAGVDPVIEARLNFGLITNARTEPTAQLRASGERCVELYRSLDDPRGLAEALRGLAQIIGWYFREDRELADALACESIAIARGIGDPILLASSIRTRGLTIDISDFAAKRAALEESLAIYLEHGNARMLSTAYTWISEMEFSAGDEERALTYGVEAVRHGAASGSAHLHAGAATNLALYAAARGDRPAAYEAAETAIRLSRAIRQEESLTFAIQALAIVREIEGEPRDAARLLGFCDARVDTLHPGRQADQSEDILHRRLLARLESVLGDALPGLLAEGASANEDDILSLAASR